MFEDVLKEPLYPHQIEALRFHLEHKYSINGFEMGLGKTIVALALAEIAGGLCVVVCPAYLKRNWVDEIERFSRQKATYSVQSYEAICIPRDTTTVIFEEVHYLKNIGAQRTQKAHNAI